MSFHTLQDHAQKSENSPSHSSLNIEHSTLKPTASPLLNQIPLDHLETYD
ncbi:hypothetical protein [Rubritalea tangerina]|uniref:Uncharacterized protein n=1 Tax=Rubritalea tangerina TaxID=430798 RepID=A0ABW4Z859_9BACT